jgi:hypothetical protein
MPDDAVTILRRSRSAPNPVNLYRHRGDLRPLVEHLQRERHAYHATALAYAESPGRDVRKEIARAAEEVAATLVRVVNQLDAILARTENEPWD